MAELKERYAEALFELFLESGKQEEHRTQAVFVRDVLTDPECDAFLRHPHISSEEKRAFVKKIFDDKISSYLMGFLFLAVEKRREAVIVPSLSEYIDKIDRYWGKMTATVVSAVDLDEKQIASLQALLNKKLDKQVEIVTITDPSLIGGFYIQMSEYIIDCTVRTHLHKIKEHLKKKNQE